MSRLTIYTYLHSCAAEVADLLAADDADIDELQFALVNALRRIDALETKLTRHPIPFRVTGPGIYRTRDGREVKVKQTNSSLYPWFGDVGYRTLTWTDAGEMLRRSERPEDLVEYLGPLPPEIPTPDWSQIPEWMGHEVRWFPSSRAAKVYLYIGDITRWHKLPESVCPRLPEGIDASTAVARRPGTEDEGC